MRSKISRRQDGVLVMYCGHQGVFVADIYRIGSAVVVRANGPVTPAKLMRAPANLRAATHHLTDLPNAGFWRPDIGVFVVPKAQLKELKPNGQ